MHVCYTPHQLARELTTHPERAVRRVRSCERCARASEVVAEWSRLADHPDPRVAAEMDQLRGVPDLLRRLPARLRFERVRADELTAWGVARLLLLEAERLPPEPPGDPLPHLEWALLADDVAARLDRDFYGEAHCHRLRRRTRATLQRCLEEAEAKVGHLLTSIVSVSLLGRRARRQLRHPPPPPPEEPPA